MSQLYGVLGVGPGADHAQIKAAFRQMAKEWHPDLHHGDCQAEQRFRVIIHAYQTLANPETRAAYDAGCAHERAAARRRFRSAAATMSASFALTVSSGLIAAFWLMGERLF